MTYKSAIQSKTPFEIRTELLAQAQSILFERLMAERMRLENDWNTQREVAFALRENGHSALLPEFPKLPTISTEEIIAEARKLNEFVSNG
jgi:hypothetical protein